MPFKTRLRVSDVYSDSDTDSDNKSMNDETPPTSPHTSNRQKITQYRYVGVCQSDMDEDGEIRVQFLTTIDGKHFTGIVNDIADVQFEDIIAKLETPEKKTDGYNMFIEFSSNIDVFEKK